MNNGYMVYLLRILAAQGALASVYTDPDDPEGFSAGFVEAVDGLHTLMCDLTPWGQIDGWRKEKVDPMRIDFVFAGQPGPTHRSRVIFNGDFYPVVSDHYGVLTEEG